MRYYYLGMCMMCASSRTCSVCLDALGWGDARALLPCGHCFHRKCLERWLHVSPTCPCCRYGTSEACARHVPWYVFACCERYWAGAHD